MQEAAVHLFLIFFFGLVVGTFWHEFVGHGLTANFYGGEMKKLAVLGVQVFPSVEVAGFDSKKGFFGWIQYEGVSEKDRPVVSLMGSVSTFVVSCVALAVFLVFKFSGYAKTIVFSFAIWFIDLFQHTLRFGEVLQAAKSLGANEWVFFVGVIGVSIVFAFLIVRRWNELK